MLVDLAQGQATLGIDTSKLGKAVSDEPEPELKRIVSALLDQIQETRHIFNELGYRLTQIVDSQLDSESLPNGVTKEPVTYTEKLWEAIRTLSSINQEGVNIIRKTNGLV